jgi:hypothetical protein
MVDEYTYSPALHVPQLDDPVLTAVFPDGQIQQSL